MALWVLLGLGYSVVQTPSGRLLRRSALSEDRPAVFAAQFALSHGCWLITYPLAGWLGARMGMGPTFAVLALIAAASVALALAVWPSAEEEPVPHRHENLPPDHPHLREGKHARGHAHPAIVDDLHPQWSKLA
jgi:predicted MFS family arabinose efflux permease